MAKDRKVEWFRNLYTGHVWAGEVGTPAHARMRKGLASEQFERVQPERKARKDADKTDEK